MFPTRLQDDGPPEKSNAGFDQDEAMTIPYKTPLSYIEGIGPRTAQRLATLNLYYVFDLIRASAEQIHPAVSGVASVDEVRRWRSMAILLQVDTMTNHWAEALVRAGVKTIEELSGKSAADLTQLFAAARRKRVALTIPTAQDALRMLLDATVIHFTGGLNGTVQNRNGHGIPDVEARIGLTRTTTDERGRFRLIRIPLGVDQQLTLRHPQYRTASIDSPPLSSNDDLIGVSTFVLTPRSSADHPTTSRCRQRSGSAACGPSGLCGLRVLVASHVPGSGKADAVETCGENVA